ncbi:MAG: glycosyl transferase [Alphaproteobacteria bacterium]|nr:glycosyl transferase [Alphaproteobacteria bacterium]
MIKKLATLVLQALPDALALHLLFFYKLGRFGNFAKPRTLNEKINWRKLYQRDPRFSVFADKLAVKDEIAKLIGPQHVIPTLWSGDRGKDIPFDQLKPPYVIKTNHGCNDSIFVKDAQTLDRKAVIEAINKSNAAVFGLLRREWLYWHIKPKILIETMLTDEKGAPPKDYKFFVYHGYVHFVQVDEDRFGAHRRAFFDHNWNKLPFTMNYPLLEEDVEKPASYELMVELATRIGSLFDFARVDFYAPAQGVFFGEVTFYPASGIGRFHPDLWDEVLGKPWVI